MAALDAIRRAARANMAPGNAGDVLAHQAALELADIGARDRRR